MGRRGVRSLAENGFNGLANAEKISEARGAASRGSSGRGGEGSGSLGSGHLHGATGLLDQYPRRTR